MRFVSFASAVAILLLASACGTRSSQSEPASVNAADTATTPSAADLGSWGVELAEPDVTARHISLAENLAVFARPRRVKDDFGHEAMDFGSDSAEGRELPRQSRLLLSDVGAQNLALYGVPTDRGWVCTYLVYPDGEWAGGGTCENGLVSGFGLNLDGEGVYYQLYGVVANDVQDVFVIAGGKRFPTRVGENGFYFESKTTSICPWDVDRLVVQRKDGDSVEVDFRHLAPALDETRAEQFGCI